jgi:CRISPR-associated exonuclease Cas4
MLAVIAVVIIILGLLALGWGRRWQVEAGLPAGQVVYSDTRGWKEVARPLYSPLHHLAGRPDYLVRRGKRLIPVEVKSSHAPGEGPHRSHILQLAAYCLLVEAEYQHRPERGIIKYADRMFEVDYTPGLESALLDTLDAMRDRLAAGGAARSHHEPARCIRCGYRQLCDERLA